MTFLILSLAVLAVAGIVGSVVLMARDGYRSARTHPFTEPASAPARSSRRALAQSAACDLAATQAPPRAWV